MAIVGSFITVIAICLVVGVAVVAFAMTGVGSSSLDGCVMLLMLLAIGVIALTFLLFFGIGCAAVFTSVRGG